MVSEKKENNEEDKKKQLSKEQMEALGGVFQKAFEPYSKAITAQGQRLQEISDLIVSEILPKMKKLEPVFEQLDRVQSGQGPPAPEQGQPGNMAPAQQNGGAPIDTNALGVIGDILKSLGIGANPEGNQMFQKFLLELGANYLKASTNMMNAIVSGVITKQTGINVTEELGMK